MGVVKMSLKKYVGLRQEAWADVGIYEVPYEGADDFEAIRNAVWKWDGKRNVQRHGWGVLRYDGGYSAVKLVPERKVVVVEHRSCLVD